MMGKTGRALRGRPCPATACSRAGSVAVRSVSSGSTERLVVAIARGYEVTLLRYRSTRPRFNSIWCTQKKGRLRCHKRPKSREETPKVGSDSWEGHRTRHRYDDRDWWLN